MVASDTFAKAMEAEAAVTHPSQADRRGVSAECSSGAVSINGQMLPVTPPMPDTPLHHGDRS
jgi:hypothetical protein